LEQRAAALRSLEIAQTTLNNECRRLTGTVSAKVDALLKDLPDAQDPEFETKYKKLRKKLQKLIPKTSNKSKQKPKTKKK